MAGYPASELEDALRRAFVDRRADFVVLRSRRQGRFLFESAALGVDRGWLTEECYKFDEQDGELRYRLTADGRRHFGSKGE